MLTQQPIGWHYGSSFPWEALTGDPQSWRDYEVSADADLLQSGQAELVGRVDGQNWGAASGYHFNVDTGGQWSLQAETFSPSGVHPVDTVLARGTTAISAHQWHRLGMRFAGDQISVTLDGAALASVRDGSHSSGLAGVGVGQTQQASQSDGIITGYTIAVSLDGTHFHQVASGTWAADTALKSVTFSPQQARYIRLEATAGVNGYAAASEINVMTP